MSKQYRIITEDKEVVYGSRRSVYRYLNQICLDTRDENLDAAVWCCDAEPGEQYISSADEYVIEVEEA